MNKLRLKSFMAAYYSTGWQEGIETLDKEVNEWIMDQPDISVDKIEHTRFETHEAIHIWYYV